MREVSALNPAAFQPESSRESFLKDPFRRLLAILCFVLTLLFLASLFVGRMDMGAGEITDIMLNLLTGGSMDGIQPSHALVFTQVRFPRTLCALLLGVGLSVSGAGYQALFRNPLVSPGILGVTAGCTFGAALGLILPGSGFGTVRFLSFFFGLLSVYTALGIARTVAVKPVLVLVLSGLVVSSVFGALLMVTKYLADPYNQLPAIVFWTMGSLHRVTWKDLAVIGPVVGGGVLFFHMFRYRLNILSLGDLQARSLGTNPGLFRVLFISVSSLMVAVTVSACGQVGWVGLVIPHMARTVAGPDHMKMIPVTALAGGIFMVFADGVARTLTAAELPIGIVTALIGAPVFAFLLYKNRGSGWL